MFSKLWSENAIAVISRTKLFAIRLTSALGFGFSMHEWALAEAVIKTAQKIANEEGLKQVKEINIKIGELQQVERPIFRFALNQLKTQNFEEAKFHISTAKATLKCRRCQTSWEFKKVKLDKESAEAIHFVPEVAHTFIKCPNCGSPDFEIIRGRGVWLESIRGVK